MVEIILLGMIVLQLIAYNDIKNYIEQQKFKEKEKETILRKGLM